jgi:hypothetical protein
LLDEVYDACDVFTSKDEMAAYSVEGIKKNDLILMESKITRYQTRNTENKWGNQCTQMELITLLLLHSADPSEGADKEATQDITGLRI